MKCSVQASHKHSSPTNAAALPQHLPLVTRSQQISLTSSPPEVLWALCNSFPWGCCIKSLLLQLNDTWSFHHGAHISKQSAWWKGSNESPQQEHWESKWAQWTRVHLKGQSCLYSKDTRWPWQKQLLTVVTELLLGDYDDSWSGQSIVRAAHTQAAVPGDVTDLWSEAELYQNTQCNWL